MAGRVKGFAPWTPRGNTAEVLADVNDVLEEYRQYLPLTVRQVFYRLVAEKGYPKTEKFYKNKLKEYLVRARRCGLIPFDAIRDDGVSRQGGERPGFVSPEQYYRTYSTLPNFYKREWHKEQPARVAVLCEAAGMVPMVARAVGSYRIGVSSSSGFDSITVKYDLWRGAATEWDSCGRKTVLLHLGDHDPSGESVHESMAEDFDAFSVDRGYPLDMLELRRIALTPEQIEEYDIEARPDAIKWTDSRATGFASRGLLPAQLEAIQPNDLVAMVREAVEDALDMETLRASKQQEEEERKEVQKKLDEVNQYLAEAFGIEGEGS